jgi:hypothetical protein
LSNLSTIVVAVALLLPLFGSIVVVLTVAVFVISAFAGIAMLTLTTIFNTAISLAAIEDFVNVTVPVPPAAGDVMAQPTPLITIALTNVVLAGAASVKVTLTALLGPLLVSVIVYVRFDPAITGSGESVLVMARSASGVSVSVSVAVLLPGAESVNPPGAVTLAVFDNVPVAAGWIVPVTV